MCFNAWCATRGYERTPRRDSSHWLHNSRPLTWHEEATGGRRKAPRAFSADNYIMSIPEHVQLLKQGGGVWNLWRSAHPEQIVVDLRGAKLFGVNLRDADL